MICDMMTLHDLKCNTVVYMSYDDVIWYECLICICDCVAMLDIPVFKSRVQSLHVLFELFSEFKSSQVGSGLTLFRWLVIAMLSRAVFLCW